MSRLLREPAFELPVWLETGQSQPCRTCAGEGRIPIEVEVVCYGQHGAGSEACPLCEETPGFRSVERWEVCEACAGEGRLIRAPRQRPPDGEPEGAAERPACHRTGEAQIGADELLRLLRRRSWPALRADLCPWCGAWHVRGVGT